jgi:hypothetical protein
MVFNSNYKFHKNKMNLLKTAQLNIHDVLTYLNHKKITDERRHFAEQ